MMYLLDFKGTLSDGSVYADVPEFLRMLGNEAVIVTAGSADQEPAIREALQGIPRVSIMFTGDLSKGEFLAERFRGSQAIFVDDNPHELASVAKHCPSIRLFEMRRDGRKGDGQWEVVHSLTELP